MIERPRSQVVVFVWPQGPAGRLVDHARHLATALESPWTVVSLAPAQPSAAQAVEAVQGVRAAQGVQGVQGVQGDPVVQELQELQDLRDLPDVLEAAAQAGAAVARAPLPAPIDQLSPDDLLAQVVASAQAHQATTVLIAPPPSRHRPWPLPPVSPRLWAQHLRRALPGVQVHMPGAPALPPPPAWAGAATLWQDLPTALAMLAVCTGIAWALKPWFEPANLIMVYLAGMVYVALKVGRPMALLAVVGSVFLYDLLFMAPSGSPKPSQAHYLLVSSVMLLVGFIISQLAARSRQQAAMAELRAGRAQALNHLALELVKARSPQSIAAALALAVHRTLAASAQLLLVAPPGTPAPAGAHNDAHNETQQRLVALALAQHCDTGAGTLVEPQAPYRCLLLTAGDQPLAVVAVDLLAQEHDSPEDRQLLKAFANQAALALDRAVFEQRSAQAAVQAEGERLRNTLLAGLSHDFRTPLTTIVGAATSLIEQGHVIQPAQSQALLHSVLDEARRMHAVTSNLLDLTRMQEGALQPRPEWCPADELVQEACTALARRLAPHRVTVAVSPDTVVWCDPLLVGQLLVNLLDNATRHAPGAAIAISIQADDNHWELVVQDDGPGVALGQEAQVFKKFFRGRAGAAPGAGADGDTGSGTGTGLGLAICAAVAELHGGTLQLQSPGRGARFVLRLPQPRLNPAGMEDLE